MTTEDSNLTISGQLKIPLAEIDVQAIRAQGAGGQNVNKVSSAIHLRFDIRASSLPALYKERLLALRDRRISSEGVLVLKAQRFRSQEKPDGRTGAPARTGGRRHHYPEKAPAHQAEQEFKAQTHGQQDQTRPAQVTARPGGRRLSRVTGTAQSYPRAHQPTTAQTRRLPAGLSPGYCCTCR